MEQGLLLEGPSAELIYVGLCEFACLYVCHFTICPAIFHLMPRSNVKCMINLRLQTCVSHRGRNVCFMKTCICVTRKGKAKISVLIKFRLIHDRTSQDFNSPLLICHNIELHMVHWALLPLHDTKLHNRIDSCHIYELSLTCLHI